MRAQPWPYVVGGAGAARHDGATTEEHRTYIEAPGGMAPIWFVGAGVRLTHTMSIEGEYRRTGRLTTVQPSRYFITYSAQRRDTIISAGARFHLPAGRTAGFEPVATFDVVREESWLATKTTSGFAPPEGEFSEHYPFVNSWGYGVGLGADVRFGSDRVAFMPGFRVRRLVRGEEAISTWPGGRSEWSVEFGAAVRVGFPR